MSMIVFGIFFFCATLSWWLTRAMRSYALRKKLLDIPNERSSHATPTPRGGGVAIVASFSIGFLLAAANTWDWFEICIVLLPSLGIAVLGWLDDRWNLPAKKRFPVQILLAAVSVWGLSRNGFFWNLAGLELNSLWLTAPVLVLFTGWMTNLYNFMDGIDGIAAGQTVSVAAVAALMCWPQAPSLALVYVTLAAAASGFLYWNWSPARIFMGDVGSAFIGFVFAALSIYGHSKGVLPLTAALLLHMSFLADTTITLLVRFRHGEKVHQAHRDHVYQHATQAGLPHAWVAKAYIAANVLWFAPLAEISRRAPDSAHFLLLLGLLPALWTAWSFKAGQRGAFVR